MSNLIRRVKSVFDKCKQQYNINSIPNNISLLWDEYIIDEDYDDETLLNDFDYGMISFIDDKLTNITNKDKTKLLKILSKLNKDSNNKSNKYPMKIIAKGHSLNTYNIKKYFNKNKYKNKNNNNNNDSKTNIKDIHTHCEIKNINKCLSIHNIFVIFRNHIKNQSKINGLKDIKRHIFGHRYEYYLMCNDWIHINEHHKHQWSKIRKKYCLNIKCNIGKCKINRMSLPKSITKSTSLIYQKSVKNKKNDSKSEFTIIMNKLNIIHNTIMHPKIFIQQKSMQRFSSNLNDLNIKRAISLTNPMNNEDNGVFLEEKEAIIHVEPKINTDDITHFDTLMDMASNKSIDVFTEMNSVLQQSLDNLLNADMNYSPGAEPETTPKRDTIEPLNIIVDHSDDEVKLETINTTQITDQSSGLMMDNINALQSGHLESKSSSLPFKEDNTLSFGVGFVVSRQESKFRDIKQVCVIVHPCKYT